MSRYILALLCVLMLLQFYWGSLILKAAWGIVVKGQVDDNRSDSDWEPEDSQDAKKNQ